MANIIKAERSSNIELFRIVVMLFIIAHHYVQGYGTMLRDDNGSIHFWFLNFLGMWGKTGINCFVLITGYFMCRSDITLRKFLKLLFEIEFYSIVIYLIFTATGYVDFSIAKFLRVLWPINDVNGGFTSGYLLYFLFIPFLNILVRNMRRNQHLVLIGMSLFVYTILGKIPEEGEAVREL